VADVRLYVRPVSSRPHYAGCKHASGGTIRRCGYRYVITDSFCFSANTLYKPNRELKFIEITSGCGGAGMHRASIAVRLTARGLVETYRNLQLTRDVLSQGPEMAATLRRGMALVSAVAMRDGFPSDIASQVNTFTVLTGSPIKSWGPRSFTVCDERDAVLLDLGYGVPTADCFELAGYASEADIAEDLFHDRLRSGLSSLSANDAATLYRQIRESIIRNPVRTRAELLRFAQEFPEMSSDLPGFYRPLPASALDGHLLRVCAFCRSPLFPTRERRAYPIGRCAVRECRLANPGPKVGSTHEVLVAGEWRLADAAIMTYWVGPGLPEINLYDALREKRKDVELYPMCDMADIGIGGLDVGIDLKSYSSAAVLGQRFARDIGGLRAFRRRIVAIPDFWIAIDRDYLRTASKVSGAPDGIEFLPVSNVIREFAA